MSICSCHPGYLLVFPHLVTHSDKWIVWRIPLSPNHCLGYFLGSQASEAEDIHSLLESSALVSSPVGVYILPFALVPANKHPQRWPPVSWDSWVLPLFVSQVRRCALPPRRWPPVSPQEAPQLTSYSHCHVACYHICQVVHSESPALGWSFCPPLSVCPTWVDEPNSRSQHSCCLPCPNAVNQSMPSCVLRYASASPLGLTILLLSFKFPQRSQLGNQEVLRASDIRGTERGADRVPLALVEKKSQQKARAAVNETWQPC